MGFVQRIKDTARDVVKSIGANWQTVGTVVPRGDEFLHFLSIATAEDSPQFIRISDPYIDNSWVYACTQVMSANLAQAPFQLMIGEEPVKRTSTQYGGLWRLFNNVSPYMNRYALIESIIVWLSIRGECFWRLVRNKINGDPVRIEVLVLENLSEVVKDGEVIGWKLHRNDGKIESIEAEDIIQFKYYNPYNKYRGMSPLVASMLGLHIDFSAAAFNYYFFNNSASPHVILETEQGMNHEEAMGLLERFNKKHRGLKKAGASAILTHGAKAQVVAMAQKDIEYINQRKWSRGEVFAVLNVPPALAQVLEDSSIKSNIREQRKQLFENNLMPKAALIEDVLRTEFFERFKIKGVSAQFDFSQVEALREDMDKKVEQAERLAKIGFTRNEINEKLELGYEKQPWGDSWWIPVNLIPVNDTGESVLTIAQPQIAPQPKAAELPAREIREIEYKVTIPERERLRTGAERIERRYADAVRDYIYNIRQEVISNVFNKEGYKQVDPSGLGYDLLFDIGAADIEIMDMSMLYISEAYGFGIESLSQLGSGYDLTAAKAKLALHTRSEALKEINATLAKQLQERFEPILARGIEQGLSYEAVAQELAESARNVMNNARSRAMTIAVTEINGAMNQGRFETMQEYGAEKHMWSTSQDARVRESHYFLEGKVVKVGEEFAWGLTYPGDMGAPVAETINCRCVTIPVQEG